MLLGKRLKLVGETQSKKKKVYKTTGFNQNDLEILERFASGDRAPFSPELGLVMALIEEQILDPVMQDHGVTFYFSSLNTGDIVFWALNELPVGVEDPIPIPPA